MQRVFRFSSIFLFFFAMPLFYGCGGDAGSSASSDSNNNNNSSTGYEGVTYFPLSIYEAYADFSGAAAAGKFQLQGSLNYPLVTHYFINPVDASTLETISTAVSSDYTVTIDEAEIDVNESHPVLQKVEGNTVNLQTALVFDLSESVRASGVDMAALIAEAKAYIAAARASSDAAIATQQYVVWVFGTTTAALLPAFTNVDANVNTALDAVVTNFNTNTRGTGSNLHRAIVETVGRYSSGTYDFSIDGIDDMYDQTTADGINLTQMVVFSSGADTVLEFDAETMTKAIESQQLLKYVADSDTEVFLNKPVFYYVVGGSSAGETYETLGDQAEETTSITMTGGAYDFAAGLVLAQIDAIDARIDRNNQYLYRYAFLPRLGAHKIVFKSSNATGYNYSLTSETDGTFDATGIGTPYDEFLAGNILFPSLVEITGANGEYLSGDTAAFADMQTFAPALRWWTDTAPGYSWSITNGTGTTNADGTYTVTAVTTSPATVTLSSATYGSYSISVTN